jgi:hypothetical protein
MVTYGRKAGQTPNIRAENMQIVVNGDTAWVMNEEVISVDRGEQSF